MKKTWLLLSLLVLAPLAQAADLPYDTHADARAQVDTALAAGKRAHKPTLLIFGANWCGDCRALDASLHSERNAALIRQHFEVVKIDVGNWDHNLDVSQAYGNPIEKGIPAAVVVSPEGGIVYTTKAGELANARKMSDEGIYDFFSQVATRH
ncbi:thioredoxin family protein [Xanthomonas massiliensis]|uniref:thioredoxin family protein n=1 Tax=Xanthomonas massiliensis TaxID=1720302 RepID=UPI0008242A1E|nr:thioredoxin family protein [Xanthomonas massiliensis]